MILLNIQNKTMMRWIIDRRLPCPPLLGPTMAAETFARSEKARGNDSDLIVRCSSLIFVLEEDEVVKAS